MSIKKVIDSKGCDCQPGNGKWPHHGCSCSSGIYCLGVIGAAWYFFPQVTSFGSGVVAVAKCFVWPAMLVFQALTLLKL